MSNTSCDFEIWSTSPKMVFYTGKAHHAKFGIYSPPPPPLNYTHVWENCNTEVFDMLDHKRQADLTNATQTHISLCFHLSTYPWEQ